MRAVRLSEDIVSVSDFEAQAAKWLQRVAETDQPLVITQNGKAAAVLISPAEFDRLSEHARFMTAVKEGLADADAGQLRDHDDVVARMRSQRLGKRSR
jgi:prevent-host-death family protein